MSKAWHRHDPAPVAESSRGAAEITVFDRASVRAVDRAAIDEFGIPGIVLMENAALGLCDHALHMLTGADPSHRTLIVCGSGNNGGDGYALARHLHNRGVGVTIAALGQPQDSSDAGINRRICDKMRLPIVEADRSSDTIEPAGIALIVDAVFGTGLNHEVTGAAAGLIGWINAAKRPVLAVDVPSGMDCNTGLPTSPDGTCVRADTTVTFVGWKTGYLELHAQRLLGEVVIAGIGAPRELIDRFGRRVSLPSRPESPEHGMEIDLRAIPGRHSR